MYCTQEAKLCPDGSYVGRDSSNNCAFAPCPVSCSKEECGPAMGMPNWECPDGSVGGPVCGRDEAGTCGWHVRDCPNDSGFSDVPTSHPNSDAIFYVKSHGMVEGYSDGTYRPGNTINRAEFVKILVAVDWSVLFEGMTYQEVLDQTSAGRDTDCMKNSHDAMETPIFIYDDIGSDAWFIRPVCHATASNWVEGYPDGTFRPADSINFVEAAKILAKAYGLEASMTIPACDGDCPWYRPYVLMLEMKGAIPMSITRFDQNITRGEMAEMVYRLRMGSGGQPSRTYEDLVK